MQSNNMFDSISRFFSQGIFHNRSCVLHIKLKELELELKNAILFGDVSSPIKKQMSTTVQHFETNKQKSVRESELEWYGKKQGAW